MKTKRKVRRRKTRKQKGGLNEEMYRKVLRIAQGMRDPLFSELKSEVDNEISPEPIPGTDQEWIDIIERLSSQNIHVTFDDDYSNHLLRMITGHRGSPMVASHWECPMCTRHNLLTTNVCESCGYVRPSVVQQVLDEAYSSLKTIVETGVLDFAVLKEQFEFINTKFDRHGNPLLDQHGNIRTRKLTPEQWAQLLKKLSSEGIEIQSMPPEITRLYKSNLTERHGAASSTGDEARHGHYIEIEAARRASAARPITRDSMSRWKCSHCNASNQASNTNCQRCGYHREHRDQGYAQDFATRPR
jgi:hypothetical protein